MFQELVSKTSGAGVIGMIGLFLFFIMFLLVLIWTLRVKKSYLEKMSQLPLQDAHPNIESGDQIDE